VALRALAGKLPCSSILCSVTCCWLILHAPSQVYLFLCVPLCAYLNCLRNATLDTTQGDHGAKYSVSTS